MTLIPILYEDGEALVIDKPSGLPIDRPRRGGKSLEDHLDGLKLGFQRLPLPVHRLDTDTSGCLLLARNPKAHKRFARAFEDRLVGKRYLGVLAGIPNGEEGTIELSLSKISSAEKGWRMIAAKKGKPSVTHWRLLDTKDGRALIEFRPETGRTHQIRIHCEAGLGLPLLGDPVYGNGATKGAAPRTMLHAAGLTVTREGKTPIEAVAPLPPEFRYVRIMGKIADRALDIAEEKFIASSGPGGQNVNKVATAVQLRVDVFRIGLPPEAFERLKEIAGSKLTKNGEIVLTANEYRTQDQNREAARERLTMLLREALTPPKRRAKSRVNRVGKVKRLKAKKERGAVKANRGKVDW